MDATTRFDSALAHGTFDGTIMAVFQTSVVAVDEGERMITLLSKSREVLPDGVVLSGGLAGLAAGQPVRLVARTLVAGDRRMCLEGEGTRLEVDGTAPFVSDTLRFQLRCAADSDGDEDGVLVRRLRECTHVLARALLASDLSAIEPAVAGLAGLGKGSTPSGDDLLTGVTAAMARLACVSPARRIALDELTRALQGISFGTTAPAGREMMRHAASGRFAEPLALLAGMAGDPRTTASAFRDVTGRVSCLGASSGSDMLNGFFKTFAMFAGSNRRVQ